MKWIFSGRVLYLVVALCPVANLMREWYWYLCLVCFGLIFARHLYEVANQKRKFGFGMLAVVLVLVTWLLCVWSSNTVPTAVGLCLIYSYYLGKEDLKIKPLVYCFLCGILTSIGIGLFRPMSPWLQGHIQYFQIKHWYRFAGVSYNPNHFTWLCMFGIAIVFYLLISTKFKSFENLVFYMIYVVLIVAVVFSFSKSAILIFAVIFPMVIAILFIKHRKQAIPQIIALCLVTITVLACCFQPIKVLFTERLVPDTNNYNEFTTTRFDIQIYYLKEVFSSVWSFLFGFRVGKYNELPYPGHSHNVILQWMFDVGFVGAVLILIILFCGCKKNLKKIKWQNIISIVTLCLFSMFEVMWLDFWVMLVMCFSMFKIN